MILSTAALLGALLFNPITGSAPGPAAAKAAPVADMSVQIWPEYDDPRVLVIYTGQVDSSVSLPTDFSLVIPAGAQINMAGGIEPDGSHVPTEYQTQARDDGLVDLSYKLTTRRFYMEFYYDPLDGSDDRSFTYAVVVPGAVGKLVVKVQHPRRADDFTMSPAAQEVVQGGDGFPYSVIEHDGMAAGTSLPVSVAYHKTDRKPSVQPKSAQMQAGPTPAQSTGGWRMFAVGLLAGVAACAVFHILRPGDRDGEEDEDDEDDDRPHRLRVADSRRPAAFCTECGGSMAPEDQYCGACGKRRRVKAAAT